MLLEKIPGLERAVARARVTEEAFRRRAFLPCAPRIGRINVRPFTPRHFMLLDEARSPLIGYSGDILPEHIAQFLWIVCTEFLVPTHETPLRLVKERRRAFVGKIRGMSYLRVRKQIAAFLKEAFFDAPPAGTDSSEEAPCASLAAHLVDSFGPGALDTPFAQLFQLQRLKRLRTDPDYYPPNPLSDRVEKECVRRWVNRQAARGKKTKR